MAYVTQNTQSQPVFVAALQRFFAAIGNALVAMGESHSRAKQIEALQAMTDEQLAERGIRREEIVRHVFRDTLYI